MAARSFDLGELFGAVSTEREARGLTWAALSREVGVAASTIRRFAEADDAEADGVLALVRWLGVVPEDFVGDNSVTGERLQGAGPGYVRVDMESIARASGDPRIGRGRSRTTIQTLTEVAQRAGQSVASLTRLSDV